MHKKPNALVYAALVLMLLALAFGLASSSRADGYVTSGASGRAFPITCYAKLIGSGEFVTDRMDVAGVTIDSMGQSSLGIGGQLGCDYSKGRWLAGLFGDAVWNKASVDITSGGVSLMHIPFTSEYSFGGRVGVFPTSATLLYGLVAYEVANQSVTMLGVPLGANGPKGVALGGGIETALTTNLVVSLEYRHVGFDTQTTSVLPMRIDTTDNNVRLGVGVRF